MGNLQLKWSNLGLFGMPWPEALVPQTRECVSIFGTFAYFILIFCTYLGFKLAIME